MRAKTSSVLDACIQVVNPCHDKVQDSSALTQAFVWLERLCVSRVQLVEPMRHGCGSDAAWRHHELLHSAPIAKYQRCNRKQFIIIGSFRQKCTFVKKLLLLKTVQREQRLAQAQSNSRYQSIKWCSDTCRRVRAREPCGRSRGWQLCCQLQRPGFSGCKGKLPVVPQVCARGCRLQHAEVVRVCTHNRLLLSQVRADCYESAHIDKPEGNSQRVLQPAC